MGRRYKCPYCNDKYERDKLIIHIDKKHEDLIPEGFTATRVVFNMINKRTCGYCRVCGKETEWNETSGKYSVLCNDPKCKEALRKQYQQNMIRVRGTDNILNDPDQQVKMLANRKISGKYKFKDGGILTYTGTYEKNCLEFMDKVMEIPSKDILSPGPTMEYEYNGEKHIYIADFYLIPQNLIIEVKDGGDNPNTKNSIGMKASREKTIAKEKLITDRGEYNYVRLTNNDFPQLISILMEIKKAQFDKLDGTIVRVNEEVIIESIFNKNKIYINEDYRKKRYNEVNKIARDIVKKYGDGKYIKISKCSSEYKEKCIYNQDLALPLFENSIPLKLQYEKDGTTQTKLYKETNTSYNKCVNALKDELKKTRKGSITEDISENDYNEFTNESVGTFCCHYRLCNFNEYVKEAAFDGINNSIILYHGTDNTKFKMIIPNSYNVGTKFSKPRMSSYWFNNEDFARTFATMTILDNNLPKDDGRVCLDTDMKILVLNKYKQQTIKLLKKYPGCVYYKTVGTNIVSRGHTRYFPEYTIDIPVKPDGKILIGYKDMIYRVKFVDDKYYNTVVMKYATDKTYYDISIVQKLFDIITKYPTGIIPEIKRELKNYTKESLYRVTYDGVGIYEALKNNVSFDEWKYILSCEEINWLPKPPEYGQQYRSYFTQDGYDRFCKDTLPFINNYLNKNKIKVEKKFYKLDEPIYRDKYQVIVYRISESVISEGSLIGLIGLAGSNPELKLELKNYIKSNTKSIHKSIQLYHGSPIQGLKYIEPRECISRIGKNTLVFASDDPRFAACYGAEWRDDTARQGTWDDWNTVVMGISDEVKMNNPCSIYILDNDGSFIQVSNKECVSDHKIKVKKEIKFKTFRDMLNYYEIKVIPYDNYVNSVGKANIDESVITESKTSTYSYTKLSSKDIDDFKEVYKTVFNEAEDPKDDVIKDMKKISKGNKLIGYVGFSYYTIKGKKYLGIGNFMVLPKYQDSGHGTKIIADIINKNKSKYNTIYCYVDKNNKGAIKFYKRIANVNTKNLTKYGYYVTLYNKEEAITEVFRGTQMKSDLDPNFVDKERLDLNDFRKVRINKSFINKYKSTYKTLQHVNSNNNGYAWLDGNKIVAYCFVDNSRELIWITAIEIDKDYKGHGLSKQLLDYAVNELGGEALTVACDNLIAKKVYDDYGFKVSKTSQANVDAHNTAALYMYLDPSKSYLAEAGEIVTEQDIEYYNKYIL